MKKNLFLTVLISFTFTNSIWLQTISDLILPLGYESIIDQDVFYVKTQENEKIILVKDLISVTTRYTTGERKTYKHYAVHAIEKSGEKNKSYKLYILENPDRDTNNV